MREGLRQNEDDRLGRVLLVEDEPLLRRAMARMLRRGGFEVVEAGSGSEALERLDTAQVDCVLSDISMPGMDGMALLKAVTGRDLDLPFVLVTGFPSLDTAIEAVEYGAFHYLRKPFQPQELTALVTRAVRVRRLARLKRQALALAGLPGGLTRDLQGLEAAFEHVLENFQLALQPIVVARSGEHFGCEVLLRSFEPSLPHPGAVLRAAERLERITELGRAIRGRAAALLDSSSFREGTLFINLHPRDLSDDQLLDVSAPLTRHAQRVVLEITERASLDGVPDLRRRVERLRDLGFRVAVDDLGAGYAGLTSFVVLQPDIVKIDMSLIHGVDDDPTRQALVRSMASVCRDMGILVVAEGIETEGERAVLAELGCDLLQGFLLGRPEIVEPGA
jgi:EAL domain-containing protein (putative c-di-GMP-specific phosphodiesterase class I)/ActR/RegA family two-component response regulator